METKGTETQFTTVVLNETDTTCKQVTHLVDLKTNVFHPNKTLHCGV